MSETSRVTSRWELAQPAASVVAGLRDVLGIHPLLARCLAARGLADPEVAGRFLEPRLRGLTDPATMPDMDRAVGRLWAAREAGELVVLFGDYDVDGITATALLAEVLGALGWRVAVYLPQRLTEGYGLSAEGVRNCLREHPTRLLVAVDCGSSSGAVIEGLRAGGTDVVVVDHHQVSEPGPAPVALLNPRRLDRGHPAGDLCSVGLAFKLAHGLVKEGRRRGDAGAAAYDLKPLLDLVALGTIADLVPLTGENRVLVAAGLGRLASTQRVGLTALMAVSGVTRPGVYAVGFQLAPRLNAAGRLEDANAALELLQCVEAGRVRALAAGLDQQNRARQALERQILQEALAQVTARAGAGTSPVIVEGNPGWHLGVVGIVAARLVREYYRPTLILGGDGEYWRGSGRSIEGFDLAGALRDCGDLLVRHGGHAMAAGVTLQATAVEALRTRLGALALERLRPEDFQRRLRLDAESTLGELTLETVQELARLEPCGPGNPAVQVVVPGVRLRGAFRRLGAEGRHLKGTVEDGTGQAEVVWWGGAGQALPAGVFDLAAQPQGNEFNGRTTVQLRLLEWRPSVSGATGP